jgi:hypothetical protein
MEIEDRLTTMEKRLHNQEKRLRYHRITVGILAFCLLLAVATHLDAQPRGRNQSGGSTSKSDEFTIMQELKARGLQDMQIAEELRERGSVFGEILVTILGRLSALERRTQAVSQSPSTNQAGSTPGLAAIEERLTTLENQAVSQQPVAPATDQMGSTVGELTCTKLTVVNSAGQPVFVVRDHSTGGQALLYAPDGDPRIMMRVSPHHGGAYVNLYGGSGQSAGITLDAVRTGTGSTVKVFDASIGSLKELGPKSHTH